MAAAAAAAVGDRVAEWLQTCEAHKLVRAGKLDPRSGRADAPAPNITVEETMEEMQRHMVALLGERVYTSRAVSRQTSMTRVVDGAAGAGGSGSGAGGGVCTCTSARDTDAELCAACSSQSSLLSTTYV